MRIDAETPTSAPIKGYDDRSNNVNIGVGVLSASRRD
jgi:hypothetical protein